MILFPLIALVLSPAYFNMSLPKPSPMYTAGYSAVPNMIQDSVVASDTTELNLNTYDPSCDERSSYVTCAEYRNLLLRQRGLDFFARHPKDKRRWEWLVRTTRSFPFYYTDIPGLKRLNEHDSLPWAPVDTAKRAEWKRKYSVLRRDLLANASVAMKTELYDAETSQIQVESQMVCARGEAVDLREFHKLILDWAKLALQLPPDKRGAFLFLESTAHFGMDSQCARMADQATIRNFIDAALKNPLPELRALARAQRQLMAYKTTPMPLHWATMSGQALDAKQLRGKVVVVDFWATTCSGCIDGFPRLKRLYDKYHAKGFDVVTVALDPPAKRKNVERIIARFGLPWHQALSPIGEDIMQGDAYRLYQIIALPYKFVLDPKGHLILYGHIADSEIERVLQQYLDT